MRIGFITITFIVVFSIFAAIGAYWLTSPLHGFVSRLTEGPAACEEPVSYAVGLHDGRFEISEEEFVSAMKEAEAVWEESTGRNLLVHSEQGDLDVNLVYDTRQETTERLRDLDAVVENTETTYRRLRRDYDRLREEYTADKERLSRETLLFLDHKQKYDQEVSYWNERDGVPEEAYVRLNRERTALDAEIGRLRKIEEALNGKISRVNELARSLNRLATELELHVSKYNEVSSTRGEVFEEGVFRSDPTGMEIDIYQFDDRDKLVRVLAHEFGHAIGLEHVAAPEAIMYRINNGGPAILADADLEELRRICGKTPTPR